MQFSLSKAGSLVYLDTGRQALPESTLGWVTRDGQMTIPQLIRRPGDWGQPRFSPDGRQVALTIRDPAANIWIYDIERGGATKLTEEGRNVDPVWTPDGTRVTFTSNRFRTGNQFDMYWRAADRSGPAALVRHTPGEATGSLWFRASSYSPDGTLFYDETAREGVTRDIWTLGPDGEASAFAATPSREGNAHVSPDGRWVAYVSDHTGEDRVYVQSWPARSSEIPISPEAGNAPVWSRDGRELFFRNGDRMMAVAWDAEQGTTGGRAQLLFEHPYQQVYDVGSDGRFLMIEHTNPPGQLNVVLNWVEELKARVPVP